MAVSSPSGISINTVQGTSPFSMDDLCRTLSFAFIRVLSTAVIEWSSTIAKQSVTNRYPIVDVLSFTSIVEIVFNACQMYIHWMDTNPQANASLWLYRQPIIRKICNALLELILNLILNIRYLKITVDRKCTYGLPRFFAILDHGIQLPIRYRMLRVWIPLPYQELLLHILKIGLN
jgi:hypothetical protein